MDATTLVDSFRIDGTCAVVTGAGSGIGRATALALAGAGATVVCADVTGDTAAATAALIADRGGTADAAAVDMSVRAEVDALATSVVADHGSIDSWCNVAGMMVEGPFVDIDESDLDRIIAVNLKGTLFGCQAAARVMLEQPGGGSIVNTSSGAADVPSPNIAAYALTKAAVVQMTKSLAIEVGPRHVRVNAVAPGFVLTGMTGRYFVRPDGSVDEDLREAVVGPMRRHTPLRAIGEPEDIAAAVLYLVSGAARFVTGQVVRPNGGVAMV